MAYVTTVNVSAVSANSYAWSGSSFAWQDPDGGKTWATAYPYTYTLSIGEGWSTGEATTRQYVLHPNEGWQTAEGLSKWVLHVLNEVWRTNEVWTDIWASMLRIFESWVTAELLAKSMAISKLDNWVTSESSFRVIRLGKNESWHIGESWQEQYQLKPKEGWQTTELAGRSVSRVIQEDWKTADSQPVWIMLKRWNETWISAESMTHLWQDSLLFVEGWRIAEFPGNLVTKPVVEAWQTVDGTIAATKKGVPEGWKTTETFSPQSCFQRSFAESWQMIEGLNKEQVLALAEALHLDEAYLKNANAVISDLAFAVGDLTLEQFTNMIATPVGYGPFTEFMPGELEYQKALIAIILAGPLTTGRPQITSWQLTVDVPNQNDGGTLAILAKNVFIPFNVRFFTAPEVMVQLRGGSAGTPDITQITDTGFYVQINDGNGQPIAGDIVWSAVGY